MSSSTIDLLTLEGLEVGFATGGPPASVVSVLRGVTLSVRRGECLGVVGESGCGKSLMALAVLGLLPPEGRYVGGAIRLDGLGNLLELPPRERRLSRGRRIAMIFQEPMSALNPVLTVGFQICESLKLHRRLKGRAARARARELLELVAMPDAERRLKSYPHELSGGQRQRAMIALALASEPQLLLADEPTTALDVTVQAQILELLSSLRRDLSLSVMLITHDLGVVAQCCDRVAVMYAGQVVEESPVEGLFRSPGHPYARALLDAVPRVSSGARHHLTEGIPGGVPEPGALPRGCSFHPRCREAFAACREHDPRLETLEEGHRARCFLHDPSRQAERPTGGRGRQAGDRKVAP